MLMIDQLGLENGTREKHPNQKNTLPHTPNQPSKTCYNLRSGSIPKTFSSPPFPVSPTTKKEGRAATVCQYHPSMVFFTYQLVYVI